MNNKEQYIEFCHNHYVPIYSKPWWMDAICGAENWDAKVFEEEGNTVGAMAFYLEKRGDYQYITKAPLTQTNGLIFCYPIGIKESSIPSFEERVINMACDYIESLHLDVYEQQYSTSFSNWSPFFWRQYSAIPRYTYVFSAEQLQDMDHIWNEMDKKKRREITKGQNNCEILVGELSGDQFYHEVEKVYDKQGLKCPFSYDLWNRLYTSTLENHAGHIISAVNKEGTVLSAKFLVWDEKSMYALISGGDVQYQHLETKSALDWYAITDAGNRGLNYDFEGSMIKRIAKAYQAFGARPRLYFRIRKVFNPDVVRAEAEKAVNTLLSSV